MARIAELVLAVVALVPLLTVVRADSRADSSASPFSTTDYVVTTDCGALRGLLGGGYPSSPPGPPVVQWLGIPFAAPPVGELRWAPPQPVTPWTGVRDATKFAPECTQDNGDGAEDCLYLNVFTPASTTAANTLEDGNSGGGSFVVNNASLLPVLLWVHGGGYEEGSASYNNVSFLASFLASSRGPGAAVVVTTNYRLNIFGFLGGNAMRPRDLVRAQTLERTSPLKSQQDHLPSLLPAFASLLVPPAVSTAPAPFNAAHTHSHTRPPCMP
jgi:para-nitrobenzyl esterase